VRCHRPTDPGGKAATDMRALLDSLRTEHARAAATLATAEHAGMEVSQVRFELNAAYDALVKARTAVHAASVAAVKAETDTGLTIAAKAYARALRALDELKFRRKGLAASLVIILVLIGGLVTKIRLLERRRRGEAERSAVTEDR
jgi:hypothetical protein